MSDNPTELEAYLWECKDYADGWIRFARVREALEYQRETGCLLRVSYRPVPDHPAPAEAIGRA